MSIKEKVIIKSINIAEKRIAKLNDLIYANPLSEVIDLRIKTQEILKGHKGDYKKIAELINPLAKKEKQLLRLAKQQCTNDGKWIDELVTLNCELGQLNNELFYHKMKNK